MNLTLSETKTNYQGRKVSVAVVSVDGKRLELGLADTTRCAKSRDAAARLIANLAGEDAGAVNGEAAKLHSHCRRVMGIKDDAAT